MNYLPHQQRVVDEHKDLQEKVVKLESFFYTDLFRTLDVAEQTRLRCQATFMQGYKKILEMRIDNFPKPADNLPDDYEV
jgi:hypothetical protein